MVATVNANTTTGVVVTSDTSGALALQTGGTTSLTIDSSQRVGIGTTSPSYPLEVSANGYALRISATTGTSRIASFLSNTSGQMTYGLESSTGGALFTGAGAYEGCIGTDVSKNFNLGTGGIVRATIDTSGALIIGATSKISTETLSVVTTGASSPCAIFKNSSSTGDYTTVNWNAGTSGDNKLLGFYTEASPTLRGSITYNRGAGVVAYNVTSDYRAKTVNGLVQNALSKVVLLKPSTGRMNDAEYDIDFFVAHELQEVVPSAVIGEKDAVNEDSTPNYQMVDKSALIPLLTAAIQELSTQVTELKAEVQALKGA